MKIYLVLILLLAGCGKPPEATERVVYVNGEPTIVVSPSPYPVSSPSPVVVVSPSPVPVSYVLLCHGKKTLTLTREEADSHLDKHKKDYLGRCI